MYIILEAQTKSIWRRMVEKERDALIWMADILRKNNCCRQNGMEGSMRSGINGIRKV